MELAELAQPTSTVWAMMDLLPKELMSPAQVVFVSLLLFAPPILIAHLVKTA